MSTGVAVLGASGFIGRHVCDELGRRGHSVVRVERRPSMADFKDLEAIDVCVHLAEPSTFSDPAVAHENAARAKQLLTARVPRIVYVSSAVVYGDRSQTPRRESDPVAPSGEYAKAKRQVEMLMLDDPRCAIARLGNVYGVGMSAKNLLSDISVQLGAPTAIRVRSLSPVRDYVHVADVARALADLAVSSLAGTVNVGTGIGTSVKALAHLMCVAADQPEREVIETESHEPSSIVLAIDRARDELGWTPSIPLEHGISKLIAGGAR